MKQSNSCVLCVNFATLSIPVLVAVFIPAGLQREKLEARILVPDALGIRNKFVELAGLNILLLRASKVH